MRLEVEITEKKRGNYSPDRTIVKMTCNHGHWKHWDNMMEIEDTELVSLTINTLYDSYYLNKPVKDVITHYDHEIWKEKRELVATGKSARFYNTLMDYIHCRVKNFKENKSMWKYSDDWKTETYTCFLFEDNVIYSDMKLEDDLIFKYECELEVKISVVD